jgi:uncharacterized protein
VVEDGPTPEELGALLRLQSVESSIRRLEHQLEELPEQAALDVAVATAEAVRAERESRRVDLDLFDSQMRKIEGELSLVQDRKGADESRMYGGEIASPKELQALRQEITHIEERIDTLEESLLEVMEQREEVAGEVAALDERGTDLAAEQERLTAARDDAAKEVLADLAELKVERDKERAAIPDDLIDRYEKAKARHGGVGVGSLESGICSACRLELTPMEISDLRDGSPLGSCPQCQRLLVVLD